MAHFVNREAAAYERRVHAAWARRWNIEMDARRASAIAQHQVGVQQRREEAERRRVAEQGRIAADAAENARPVVRNPAKVMRLFIGNKLDDDTVGRIWGYAFHLLLAEMSVLYTAEFRDPPGRGDPLDTVTAHHYLCVKVVAPRNIPRGLTFTGYMAAIGYRGFHNMGADRFWAMPTPGRIHRVPNVNWDDLYHHDWDEFDGHETVAVLHRAVPRLRGGR